MNEIVFVTHNKGKIASAQKYLENVEFKVFEYDLDEPRSEDIKYISKVKVEEAYKLVNKPCISMDSGFFIEELNGFPKAFVNFSLDTLGIEGFLKLMEGKENRRCAFRECLSYYDGENLYQFDGHHEGNLAEKICGEDKEKKWSDLWYIYKPLNSDKTLAEMTDEERYEINKRNGEEITQSSFEVFAKWYEENIQK